MCLYGFITGGEYPIIPEYAPEFTGTVFGFTNTLASSMGFLAPIIVGQILDSKTEENVSRIGPGSLILFNSFTETVGKPSEMEYSLLPDRRFLYTWLHLL